MNLSQKIINKIQKYDSKGLNNEFRESIECAVKKAVSENKPLNFISFTCSTINSEYLFSNTPWLYVNTETKGNNLEPDVERLALIVKEMRAYGSLVEDTP